MYNKGEIFEYWISDILELIYVISEEDVVVENDDGLKFYICTSAANQK